MTEFLVDEALTSKIREIVAGESVRCAVAYWGNHNFGDTKSWKIVCDIVGGATSPSALKRLGAPNNRHLKHVINLHAKVYMSDRGIVVASANASANGLGYDGKPPCLLEAGTFWEANSKAWKQAEKWFSSLFTDAHPIGKDELEWAALVYRPRVSHAPLLGVNHDLVTEVMARPEWFTDRMISFVFCSGGLKQAEYESALEEVGVADKGVEPVSAFGRWPREGRFVRWRGSDLDSLRPYFVEIYLGPKGGNGLYRHHVDHVFRAEDGTYGNFLTTRRPDAPEFLGARYTVSEPSWKFIRKLVFGKERASFHDENDEFGVVMSAEDFARILRRNLPEHAK